MKISKFQNNNLGFEEILHESENNRAGVRLSLLKELILFSNPHALINFSSLESRTGIPSRIIS